MELREDAEAAVRDIITELEPTSDPSDETSKIANLYASFMDEGRVEGLGSQPLVPVLSRVASIATMADLAFYLGWATRHGVGGLFSMGVEVDPGDPKRYLMFVGQGGLGLPDEAYYREEQHESIRGRYVDHVRASLELAGIEDAETAAQQVFALETDIARVHWDNVRTRDMVQMYYPQTWDEFVAEAPGLEWEKFLSGAELPSEAMTTVVNTQRSFPADVARLFDAERLDAWKSWAAWHAIAALSPFLSSQFSEASFNFYSKTLNGIPVQRERWKRGVSLTQGVLGEAIGKIYVERHFSPKAKERMDELVANLLEAYRRSITELDWMSDATRQEALAKLDKFTPKIGYPTKWRDYSALEVSPDDLVGNVMAASSFEFDYDVNRLSGPVDPDEWEMYPQTVNAYYHPLRNEIVFPAAILQPPFFHEDADDAINYGGIGSVIGHEIGHGFDDQGSTCDGDGQLRDWWTDEDRQAFSERTRALIDQYDGLHPSAAPDASVNGELTIGENIGDLGGLSIAVKAFQLATEGCDTPDIDGYTALQRLFLSWGAIWQDLTRPEQMRQRVATDPHSPAEFRANQTAQNVPEFHEAFDVQPGDGMWLDPADRVRIW